MNDPELMRAVQRAEHLARDGERAVAGQWTLVNCMPELAAVHVLQHEAQASIGGGPHRMKLRDVGVHQHGVGGRLALEACDQALVRRHLGVKPLDRKRRPGLVPGEEHDPHAPLAQS